MSVGLAVTQSPFPPPCSPPLTTDDHSSVEHETKAMVTKLSSPHLFLSPRCSFILSLCFPTYKTQSRLLKTVTSYCSSERRPSPKWHRTLREGRTPTISTQRTWPWVHLKAFGLFMGLFYSSVSLQHWKWGEKKKASQDMKKGML